MQRQVPANDPFESVKDQMLIQQQEDNQNMFKHLLGVSSLLVGALTGAVVTALAAKGPK